MVEGSSGRPCEACNGRGWITTQIEAPPGIPGTAPMPVECETCSGAGRLADRPPV